MFNPVGPPSTDISKNCSVQLKLPSDDNYLTLHPEDECKNPVRGEDKMCTDEWYGRSNWGIVYHLHYLANKTTAITGLYQLLMNSNGMFGKYRVVQLVPPEASHAPSRRRA